MKVLGPQTRNRVHTVYFLLTGIFVIFLIRVCYIQFIYQTNIVTFAQMDQVAQDLNASIIDEVKKSFDIRLGNYNETNTEKIINSRKTDMFSLSLLDILNSSCKEGCLGQPAIYINENHGYLFYKNETGGNVLQELKKEKDRWAITKTLRTN